VTARAIRVDGLMTPLRIAVLGCGFWSRFQIPAWLEIEDVRCVAVCDVDPEKSRATAARFNIPESYTDPAELIAKVRPDAVDIVTSPETHAELVELTSAQGVATICQKPMSTDLATGEKMVRTCSERTIPFFVHENWRWQNPIRELKRILDSGEIGQPFRARLDFNCSFPVFENQPSLRELPELILADLGVHLLDTVRFLFSEADCLTCHIHRVTAGIAGEDVATVLLAMENGMTVSLNLSFASRLESERFPETFIIVEGDKGSVELAPDYWIRRTNEKETRAARYPAKFYSWADPNYALVHASIVECHRNLAGALRGTCQGETTGADNLKTLRLVFAAYESARAQQTVLLKGSTSSVNLF
jgi:D-apiose dehydrogenase